MSQTKDERRTKEEYQKLTEMQIFALEQLLDIYCPGTAHTKKAVVNMHRYLTSPTPILDDLVWKEAD